MPHPPHRLTAPAVKNGGSLPSSPSPLARLVSSGLGRKTRTGTAINGRVVCHTPYSFFATPPPVSAWHFACPAPCHGTGTNGGHHQIAASGPVSRTVDQIWKRSIATRAVVLVGVPSGSWRSSFKRSTAVLKSAQRAQQLMITAADCVLNPGDFLADFRVGLGRPGRVRRARAVAVARPVFQRWRGAVCCLCAHANRDDLHGESPRPKCGPTGARGPHPTRAVRYRSSGRDPRTRTSPPDRPRRSAA